MVFTVPLSHWISAMVVMSVVRRSQEVRAFVASTSYETSPLVIEERFDPGHVDSKRARLERLFFTPLKISFRPLPEVQLPAIYPLEEGQTQRKSPYQHLKVQHIW